MLETLVFVGRHLLAFALLAGTAFMAGHLLIHRLGRGSVGLPGRVWQAEGRTRGRGSGGPPTHEHVAVATSLGLAALAHLALLLGLAGLLRPGPLAVVAMLIHLAGLTAWRDLGRAALARLRAAPPGRVALAAGLALLFAGPVFALALYPPTAFDETLYHLPFARAFARSGGVPFLPELRFPVFPQLGDLLLAVMLLAAGDVATHLVALLATLATAALLLAWGRRAASPSEASGPVFPSGSVWQAEGRTRRRSRGDAPAPGPMADGPAAGWLAAGLWVGSPIAVHLAGTSYIDPLLALFTTAALFGADRYRATGLRGWLALAAAFAAAAAGTKYLGLFALAVVAVAAVLVAPRGRRARDLALAAAVALPLLVLSYGRILAGTGSPVFPFYPGTFGSSWWTFPGLGGGGALDRLAAVATLPWDAVFDRAAVGGHPPFSPWLLLGLPLLLAAAPWSRRTRVVLLIAVAYALAAPPDARYLLAVTPLLCVAVGAAVARWSERFLPLGGARRRLAAAALAAAFVLPGWLYAGWRLARQGPVPVTTGERDRHLAARLPVYPAVRHLNRLRGPGSTVYAVHAENMVYFAEGRLLGDWNGPASYARVLPTIDDPELFHRKLRALGVDDLLIAKGKGVELPDGPASRRLFRPVYEDAAAVVYELRPGREDREVRGSPNSRR